MGRKKRRSKLLKSRRGRHLTNKQIEERARALHEECKGLVSAGTSGKKPVKKPSNGSETGHSLF